MKRIRFTIVKNALANVMRGGATAIVALALPHFLTRELDHDRFAAWVLMLQIAAYTNYFDFGLQTAVARYLAQAMERGDDLERDRLISTALALLAVAGILAFSILGAVILAMPHVFQQLPSTLSGEAQKGLLILAASSALSLPLSTFTGVLIGLHRNEMPALAIGISRIAGAAMVMICVHSFTKSLAWLALCIAGFNLLGGLAQLGTAVRLLPEMQVRVRYLSRSMGRRLVQYCFGLTVYSFSMLLVSGLDVTIVGYFRFNEVGSYSIAATLIAFLAGLNSAIFTAMMTPVAVLQARGEVDRIRDLVIETTRLSSYASLLITLPAFVCGLAVLRFWVGSAYATQALPILEVLLVAQAIRLTGGSYCAMLIATGQQKYGIAVALIEAFGNLTFSLLGVVWLGSIGVAWGTLIGALLAITSMFPLSMRRAKEVPIPPMQFFREGILRPVLVALPIVIYLLSMGSQNPSTRSLAVLLLTVLASTVFAIMYGEVVSPIVRTRLLSKIS